MDTWKVTSGLICPLVIVYLRCFGNGYEWVHIIIYLILYNNSIHDDSSTQVSRLLTRFCFVHVSSAAHLWLRFHLFLVDFYRGKTVFKHWLPGLCYRNVTFQLISEATINRTAMVRHSGVTHRPLQHRTGTECQQRLKTQVFVELLLIYRIRPKKRFIYENEKKKKVFSWLPVPHRWFVALVNREHLFIFIWKHQ